MNSSAWGYLLIMLGIVGIFLINMFGEITVTNEESYYLLKEVTEAAMTDAVDYQAYRVGVGYDDVTSSTDSDSMHCEVGVPGTIRIIKEKFVESFVRRFSESAKQNVDYEISFDDIDECPPKVTVTVTAIQSNNWIDKFIKKEDNYSSDNSIVNRLSAILEVYPEEE